MNKQNENKHIDTENRVVVTRRDRRSGELFVYFGD